MQRIADAVVYGNDVEDYAEAVTAYVTVCDEVYINQIRPGRREFFDAYRTEVLPGLPWEG